MNNATAKDDKISNQPGLHGGNLRLARYLLGLTQRSNQEKLEALGQCIPPPNLHQGTSYQCHDPDPDP